MRLRRVTTEEREQRNGFRLLSRSQKWHPILVFGVLIVAIAFLIFTGLWLLIPPLFFFAGCMYVTKVDKQVSKIQNSRPLSSPRVTALPLLAGAQQVTSFGKSKIAVAVNSFLAPTKRDWISAMAVSLDREIQAVITYGAPASHNNRRSDLYRIIMAELKENESAQEVADAMKQCMKGLGISAEPMKEELFEATTGHDWWYGHGYSLNLRMDTPLPDLLQRASLEKHENSKNFDCTATLTVRPGRLTESGRTITVGLDLVMFGQGKAGLHRCEDHFLKTAPSPNIQPSGPKPLYDSVDIMVIRRSKLKIGAAFVEPPIEPMHEFLCIPQAPRLSDASHD